MGDVIDGLVRLGFTFNEARVYEALVRRPGCTGYEASKHSGVPRAKVYEVLEAMVGRGVVITVHEGERQLYRPLPPDILLSRHQGEVLGLVKGLKRQLEGLESADDEQPLVTLRGHKACLVRAGEMCDEAGSSLLVGGFHPDTRQIQDELVAAERRGATVVVLQFGPGDLGLEWLVEHEISSLQHGQVRKWGRWLAVVRDLREALLCQIRPHSTTALWTENMGVVLALGMWIQHDVALNVLTTELEPDLAAELSRRMNSHPLMLRLQRLTTGEEDRRERLRGQKPYQDLPQG